MKTVFCPRRLKKKKLAYKVSERRGDPGQKRFGLDKIVPWFKTSMTFKNENLKMAK
jgi:hypothetical protein